MLRSSFKMIFTLAVSAQTWTMVVGGDIMLNAVSPSAKTFEGITKFVKGADIGTANLEIPLTRSGTTTSRKSAADVKAKKQFILRADPDQAGWIKRSGFDLVGIANNHAMDYGARGLGEMTSALKKAGVAWCGSGVTIEQAAAPRLVTTKNGVNVAFVAFLAFKTDSALWKCTPATSDSPGVATIPAVARGLESVKGKATNAKNSLLKTVKAIMAKAREGADAVVVWLHWGTERKSIPDLYQVQLGRSFVEAGADCVLGAHPHVLQGAELYAGRPVFYSLGNLISPLPATTGLFRLSFDGRKFLKAEMLPCGISGGKVAPVSDKAQPAAKTAFEKLGDAVRTKFKHPKSKALAVS